MSKTAPYRIEERYAVTGGHIAATEQGWDGPLTAAEAQNRFTRELRDHPDRYAVDSPYRLVLLGPDRTVLPRTVTEGPAL
jgi:hypothetical protein